MEYGVGMATEAPSLLRLYYLATPAFAVTDWLGANVRAVGLAGHPEWRAVYYAVCTLAGVLLYLRPRWADAVGLGEASVNVLLLVLAVLVPYFDAVSVVAAGGLPPAALPFSGGFIINFILSGAVWAFVFQQRVTALSGRKAS